MDIWGAFNIHLVIFSSFGQACRSRWLCFDYGYVDSRRC